MRYFIVPAICYLSQMISLGSKDLRTIHAIALLLRHLILESSSSVVEKKGKLGLTNSCGGYFL